VLHFAALQHQEEEGSRWADLWITFRSVFTSWRTDIAKIYRDSFLSRPEMCVIKCANNMASLAFDRTDARDQFRCVFKHLPWDGPGTKEDDPHGIYRLQREQYEFWRGSVQAYLPG
jgi:hypothetical protein